MMQLKLNGLDKCKTELKPIDEAINEIEKMKNDSDNYIYNYFQEIINQVDLRRENLKLVIDNYSEEMITNIKKVQTDCRSIDKKTNKISKNLNTI